jgi:two-component system, OmpR family, sensor histidine kinase MtrB
VCGEGLIESSSAGFIERDVAAIVHDLKSPLAAIALEAALLDEQIRDGYCFQGSRGLARIQLNVAFMDRLILDLLDLCSLADGTLPLVREPTDLRALLESVLDRAFAARVRHRVTLDADRVVASVDALRIERVIANLVDNALKYTPQSGSIAIRLERGRAAACISVIDAGPGIDPSELVRLFEKYMRGETARGRSGSGLGLYVSKRIVEAHGGRIGAETIRGTGSRFFFELPS